MRTIIDFINESHLNIKNDNQLKAYLKKCGYEGLADMDDVDDIVDSYDIDDLNDFIFTDEYSDLIHSLPDNDWGDTWRERFEELENYIADMK